LPFLFPLYRKADRPRWMVRLGMTAYDLLALYRNVEPHRMLPADAAKRLEPALRSADLTGAARFFDAQMDDARACLAVALSARAAGARVETYCRVEGLFRRQGAVAGVRAGGQDITARAVVNAAGPWLDRVNALADAPTRHIRTTRGAHLVLPPLLREHALVLRAGRDRRIFFVMPWRGRTLVGTTDADYAGDPAAVACTEEERRYLLEETRSALPGIPISESDVIADFAGVRPLVFAPGDTPSLIGREDLIIQEANGLIAIAGGKFTTGRAVAERVVELVARRLNSPHLAPCHTTTTPLMGGEPVPDDERRAWRARAKSLGLADEQCEALMGLYGSRFGLFLAMTDEAGALERLHPDLPWIVAQVDFAVDHELARTVEDVLRRRLPVALGPYRLDQNMVRTVAGRMGKRLGWDAGACEEQIARYLSGLR
ncbi:MAG: glycerol-3-phosphate dehydrogenase/oxidase, partial [Nitrospirota bacterium]